MAADMITHNFLWYAISCKCCFHNLYVSRCTQQGETRNTQTRKYFKIIVFNDDIRVTQGKVDTTGITSRPDEMEYKRQDLNTPGN